MIRARLVGFIAILIVSGFLATSLRTQEQSTIISESQPFHLPTRVGIDSETQITFQQGLALALANNKDIDGSKIDREEADNNLLGTRGLFDPIVSATSRWEEQIVPIASSLGGSATGSVLTRIWQTDPTVSGALPWLGGSYEADFNLQKTFTNNTFVTLNPQYPTSLNLQYTQPLSRGLRYDTNRHSLDVAKKNQSLTAAQFRQRVMQVVSQTDRAYWELVYAYNNLQVQLEAVDIARQQDESNRREEQQGLLAPIDVVAAQTQLANFELSAYTAEIALANAENNLKVLILADRSSPFWPNALIPVTSADISPPAASLAEAMSEALTNRPEATELKISGEINEYDLRYYRELTKPQIDLVANYTRAGLAGLQVSQAVDNPLASSFGPLFDRVNTLSAAVGLPQITLSSGGSTPPLLIGDLGQSLGNLLGGNFPTTQVQLHVSLPIRNRAAEANLNNSRAEERRIQDRKDQVEQTIEADVRNSMQTMQSAELRLETARVAERSAEEQYNSEQRQFRAGTSTLFLVQQRQSAMIEARSEERRAESDLSEAISAFHLATGSILKQHNVKLE